MSTIKVFYHQSEALRKRAFVEQGDLAPYETTVDIDLAQLTPEARGRLIDVLGRPGYVGNATNAYDLRKLPTTAYIDYDRLVRRNDKAWEQEQPITAENLAAIVEAYAAAMASRETEAARLEPEAKRLQAEHKAQREAQRKADDERAQIFRDMDAKREAAAAALREKAEAEKAAWIVAHGSDALKARIEAGYDCQRRYVTERAAEELPGGFEVDWKNRSEWQSRSCPSDAAFFLEQRITASGVLTDPKADIAVVWLTTGVTEPEPYEDDFEPCEAVVVARYLGKYTLVCTDF